MTRHSQKFEGGKIHLRGTVKFTDAEFVGCEMHRYSGGNSWVDINGGSMTDCSFFYDGMDVSADEWFMLGKIRGGVTTRVTGSGPWSGHTRT